MFVDVPIPTSIPNPCTVKWVAAHYFDIQSVPRRSFFEFLAHFATSEMEKEKLIEFTTAEGQVRSYISVSPCVLVYLFNLYL